MNYELKEPQLVEFYEKRYYRKRSRAVIQFSHLSVLIFVSIIGIGISTCTTLPIKSAQKIIDDNHDYEDKVAAREQEFEKKIIADPALTPEQKKFIISQSQAQIIDIVNHDRQNTSDVAKLGTEARLIEIESEKIKGDAELGLWVKRIGITLGTIIIGLGIWWVVKKYF